MGSEPTAVPSPSLGATRRGLVPPEIAFLACACCPWRNQEPTGPTERHKSRRREPRIPPEVHSPSYRGLRVQMSSRRNAAQGSKHAVHSGNGTHRNLIGGTYGKRRVTRSVVGSVAEIPIVLDSSSDSESSSGSSAQSDGDEDNENAQRNTPPGKPAAAKARSSTASTGEAPTDSLGHASVLKTKRKLDSHIASPQIAVSTKSLKTDRSPTPVTPARPFMLETIAKTTHLQAKPVAERQPKSDETQTSKSAPKSPTKRVPKSSAVVPAQNSMGTNGLRAGVSNTATKETPPTGSIKPAPISASQETAKPDTQKTPLVLKKPLVLKRSLVLDPHTQKPYRDTYSVCCTTCEKQNRPDFCNRQNPCDICVGKKLQNCTYPPTAEIVIPAKFVKGASNSMSNKPKIAVSPEALSEESNGSKLPSLAGRVQNSTSSGPKCTPTGEDSNDNPGSGTGNQTESSKEAVDKSHDEFRSSSTKSDAQPVEKKLSSQPVNDIGPRLDSSDTDDADEQAANFADSESSSNSDDEFDDFDEDDYTSNGNDENDSDDDDDSVDDDAEFRGDDSDDDDDDDENDEDDKIRSVRRKYHSRIKNTRTRTTVPDFDKAKRLLKELEFEKRDMDDIYGTNRQRRQATRENYFIPSDINNSSDSEDGYAAAEARNEQVILSEDEEERRMLRGEIGLEYLESLRAEREKHRQVSSDSLSSDDE